VVELCVDISGRCYVNTREDAAPHDSVQQLIAAKHLALALALALTLALTRALTLALTPILGTRLGHSDPPHSVMQWLRNPGARLFRATCDVMASIFNVLPANPSRGAPLSGLTGSIAPRLRRA
jgi:hypothetical protein